MITSIVSRILILVFGILHPAYKSYKSLRSKNQKDIITSLMYWIVFAMFLAVETFTDLLISWFPFYYECKIIFVLWMVLPVTRGYSLIFRKVIHPELLKREIEIDEIIDRATEKGYTAIMNFGAKGINFAATTVLNTAVKGQELLASRSLSLGDLTLMKTELPEDDEHQIMDEFDAVIDGHGDTPTKHPVRVRPREYKGGRYDSNTLPKRRPHTIPLNEVPEEDPSHDDIYQEKRSKVSHICRIIFGRKRKPVPSEWVDKYSPNPTNSKSSKQKSDQSDYSSHSSLSDVNDNNVNSSRNNSAKKRYNTRSVRSNRIQQ